MTQYHSHDPRLFQIEPEYGRRTRFAPKGWTTLLGYWREAGKLCQLLDLNRKLRQKSYPWAVNINIHHVLEAAAVGRLWSQVCRGLRSHDVASLWVREPSRTGHVNYHSLLTSDHTADELHRAVHASVPSGIEYHHHVKPVRYQWRYPRYITKAKVSGYVGGKYTTDKYASKRLLFTKEFGLNKYGHIGSFWVRTKGDLWRTIIAREQRVAEGLDATGVRQAVERWYTYFGGDVPRWQIERSFGYHRTTLQPP